MTNPELARTSRDYIDGLNCPDPSALRFVPADVTYDRRRLGIASDRAVPAQNVAVLPVIDKAANEAPLQARKRHAADDDR